MKVLRKGKDKSKKVSKEGAIAKVKPRSIRKEQVLVVAQEIKYARLLSGNEKNTRDRVLKALKKWLTNCFEKGYEFKEDDFLRVWKGLFYAVWMSDKPLVQEELCDSIAEILDLFPASELKHALLMAKAGFRTLATEWYGIDQHRMDKFLMLVRRYLRGSLRCLHRGGWSVGCCEKYAKMLSGSDGLFALKTPHYARNATSMLLHIVDCFLEELAKVSEGEISSESVAALLKPFVGYTCAGDLSVLCAGTRRLLTALLRQSQEGLQYADKTRAWQEMGCPVGGPDALELASDDEEDPRVLGNGDAASDEESDDGEKPLDPRAGRVDVELPLLPVKATLIANMLRDLLGKSTSKAHKRVKICLQRFETLAAGEYPLQVEAPDSDGVVVLKPKRSVRALRALEAKIKSDTDELKLRGLSRKHRKRLLKKTRHGQSIVEDALQAARAHARRQQRNGGWLVESTSTETDTEKDSSNRENLIKKNNKQTDTTRKRKPVTQQNGDVAVKKQKLDAKKIKQDASDPKKDKVSDPKKDNISDPKKDKVNNPKVKEGKVQMKFQQKVTNIQKDPHKPAKMGKETGGKVKTKKVKVESPQLLINKLRNFSKQLQKDKSIEKDKKKVSNLQKGAKPSLERGKTKVLDKKTRKIFETDGFNSDTPKKVKFELRNNSMQKPVDYYKSVRQSPSIPFDSSRRPNKTNLKPSTPSPINPFFKKKLRMKH